MTPEKLLLENAPSNIKVIPICSPFTSITFLLQASLCEEKICIIYEKKKPFLIKKLR